MCIFMADSCCMAENNTALQSSYLLIEKFFNAKKKSRHTLCCHSLLSLQHRLFNFLEPVYSVSFRKQVVERFKNICDIIFFK